MKKMVSLALILCFAFLFAVPASAQGPDNGIVPYGMPSVRGDLSFNSAKQCYVLWGDCSGPIESKTVVVTLSRESGSKWIYVDSVSNSGTAAYVQAELEIASLPSGRYKIDVVASSAGSSGNATSYRTIG